MRVFRIDGLQQHLCLQVGEMVVVGESQPLRIQMTFLK